MCGDRDSWTEVTVSIIYLKLHIGVKLEGFFLQIGVSFERLIICCICALSIKLEDAIENVTVY
jgi:hypothetical protein